ncbi:MAG: SURF1 family protein [Alphaproteobacteria bacterium]
MQGSRILATLIALPMIAALIGLGTWQVQRLAWKTDLVATMGERLQEAPMSLDAALALPPEDAEWRLVTATGQLKTDRSVALYRISNNGGAGYQVLTPMALAEGGHVLISRGFVAATSFQDALNGLPGASDDLVSVTGVLRPGEGQNAFTNDNDPLAGAWYWIDLEALSDQTGVALLPLIIVADSDPAGGDLIGGQARFDPPNQHLQYAITWYSLAVAALVIYVLLLRRRRGAGT